MSPYLYLICRDAHGILLAGKKKVCLKGTLISHFGYKERQKLFFKNQLSVYIQCTIRLHHRVYVRCKHALMCGSDHAHQLVSLTVEWSVTEYTEPWTMFFWRRYGIKAVSFSYLCCAVYCKNMFSEESSFHILGFCFSFTVNKVTWDYFEGEMNK